MNSISIIQLTARLAKSERENKKLKNMLYDNINLAEQNEREISKLDSEIRDCFYDLGKRVIKKGDF